MKYSCFFGSGILLLFLVGCGAGYGGPGDGWGHMMPYGYGGMFMWILFLIVIGVVLYVVIRGAQSSSTGGASGETPLDILKKRYAKGEITKDQFEQMKKDLGS